MNNVTMLEDLPDIEDFENNNYIYSNNNQIMPNNMYEKYKSNIRNTHVIPQEAGMTSMNYQATYTPINYAQQPNIMYYQQPTVYRESFENTTQQPQQANIEVQEIQYDIPQDNSSNNSKSNNSSSNIYLIIIIILLTVIIILLLYLMQLCKVMDGGKRGGILL